MGELVIIISVVALIFIFVIIKSVLKKNPKDLKVAMNFFNGFEFSCSFPENDSVKHI